jgi:glucose-6-phosphate isomerase
MLLLPRINPTSTASYKALEAHYQTIKAVHLSDLFKQDAKRADAMSIRWNDVLFDYSKNRLNSETLALLFSLARECGLESAIKAQFDGQIINETEQRAVLHTALRNRSRNVVLTAGKDVMPDVHAALLKMKNFCDGIHSGTFTGYSGKVIQTIVNIGIGGSDLGPYMVCEALKPFAVDGMNIRFVSNVDGTHITEALKQADPETTLFIVASKTFTTQETMANAHTARTWLIEHSKDANAVSRHFVAVSTNAQKVKEFGIAPENMFEFWDWVGGRFSLWSSIGLSIALYLGYARFEELLDGAYQMDQHFRDTPFEKNIPVLMGLIGYWYITFFNAQAHAVLPYDQYMHRFAAYLQQGEMESNGKYVDRNGQKVTYRTCPVIWGEPGTNGQHAFYQLLHQGTEFISADFIGFAQSLNPAGNHHELLMSNFFAQTEALMNGKNRSEVESELRQKGFTEEEITFHAPFRIFEGNKPSTTWLFKIQSPFNLGALIAAYEHKIFVQGVLWNIFSYDQWGVELGKQLASSILQEWAHPNLESKHDSSTEMLISQYKEWVK